MFMAFLCAKLKAFRVLNLRLSPMPCASAARFSAVCWSGAWVKSMSLASLLKLTRHTITFSFDLFFCCGFGIGSQRAKRLAYWAYAVQGTI
jgi:hypothetical protein